MAAADDDDPVTNHTHLRQDMSAQQHRMIAAQILDHPANVHNLAGVQTHRRFIEDQPRRTAHKRLGNTHTLPVSLRQLPQDAAAHIGETALFHNPRHLPLPLCAGQTLHLRHISEEAPHRHFIIQWHMLRQITHAPLHFQRMIMHLISVNPRLAPARRKKARQNAHGRAFPRTVRPEKPDNRARIHAERRILQCGNRAKIFCQAFDFNHDDFPERIVSRRKVDKINLPI